MMIERDMDPIAGMSARPMLLPGICWCRILSWPASMIAERPADVSQYDQWLGHQRKAWA